MEESKYEKFSEKCMILHKFASNYGWDHDQVFKMLDVKLMHELLDLLYTLENDQNAFVNPAEVAGYKNLLRRYPPKES